MTRDTVIDDFIKRFGKMNTFTNDFSADPIPLSGDLAIGASGVGKRQYNPETAIGADSINIGGQSVTPTEKGSFDLNKAGDAALGLAQAAPAAMGLAHTASSGNYETDALSGGPGSAKEAGMTGAMQGAQLGGQLGSLAGPVGTAVGTVVGGLGGLVLGKSAQGKAMREYSENRRKHNVEQDNIQRAENREAYRASEGLESLENLRALREKQLGIIS